MVTFDRKPNSQPESGRGNRRPEFLAAARQLFFERGYSGTTMDQVARQAGFSKRAVYIYFKNKDELFLMVGEEGLVMLREKLEQVDIEGLSVEESIALILDMQADKKVAAYKSALKQGGVLVMVGGKVLTILAVHLASRRAAKSQDKHMSLLMWKPNDKNDIAAILDMIQNGEIKLAIDRTYKIDDVVEALEYCDAGNAKGKVVITFD